MKKKKSYFIANNVFQREKTSICEGMLLNNDEQLMRLVDKISIQSFDSVVAAFKGKSVVTCCSDDEFDEFKGNALAMLKCESNLLGQKSSELHKLLELVKSLEKHIVSELEEIKLSKENIKRNRNYLGGLE